MPLYEYQCQDCGNTIEVIQKFSDDPLHKCGSCGGALERLLSAPAIQFKGSGWYVTDYARNNGGGTDKAASSAPKDGNSDGAASSKPAPEAKPAAAKT
jgi:putative FmdB family regulatory protein